MRARKKKHGAERLAACDEYLVKGPGDLPDAPYCLEIGCGKGAFVAGMAEKHPEMRFLAVERVPDILLLAAEKVRDAGIPPERVRFAVTDADRLDGIVGENTVERIYLNFSDPWPKARHAKRRLTHRDRLARYARYLVPGGEICFKTDNTELFDFTLGELGAAGYETKVVTRDLHGSEFAGENVMTEYEKNFSEKGYRICMLRAVHTGVKKED